MGKDLPQVIIDAERKEWGKEPNRFCLYLQYLDCSSIYDILKLSGKDYESFVYFYSQNKRTVDETLVIENLKIFMDNAKLKRFIEKKEEIEAWVLTMTRLLFDAIFKFLYGKNIDMELNIFANEEFDNLIKKIFGKNAACRLVAEGHQNVYALNYAYRFNQFYGVMSAANFEGNYIVTVFEDFDECTNISVKKIENEDGEYYEVIPLQ